MASLEIIIFLALHFSWSGNIMERYFGSYCDCFQFTVIVIAFSLLWLLSVYSDYFLFTVLSVYCDCDCFQFTVIAFSLLWLLSAYCDYFQFTVITFSLLWLLSAYCDYF